MPAGGFKTFVAGEILTAADTNAFLMQGILVFDDATARDAAITSPVEGQFAFRKDDDALEYHDGSGWEEYVTSIEVEYLVVAGGGGGGRSNDANAAGGAGAGGFLTGFVTVTSDPVPITVGLGGAGATTNDTTGASGTDSFFSNVRALQGSGGGGPNGLLVARHPSGGSSGAKATANVSATEDCVQTQGTIGQGNGGGSSRTSVTAANLSAGGGGGAGSNGVDATTPQAGAGGDGLASSLSGSSVTYAGGGGGGSRSNTGGAGGSGGGGAGGSANAAGSNASPANTGSGGGGSSRQNNGGNGSSGVVIFQVDTVRSVSFSAGVTHTTATVGDKTAYIVTAAGPTDTVTIG